MRARCVDDALGQGKRVAPLNVHLEAPGVELAREQEVVDDVGESRRLLHDYFEQLRLERLLELDVVAPKRQCRAVDRGKRSAELVGDGRNEVLADLFERAVLGGVAKRIDGPFLEADSRDGDPALCAVELEGQSLCRRRAGRTGHWNARREMVPARQDLQ